jgi:1-acyl-sn-glycerol-3-phosphate acyltransferase
LLAPLVFVCAAGLALMSPLIHLWAAVIDLIFDRKRWRTSRFVGVGLAFSVVEVFGLFTLLTVWIGSGFGLWMNRPFWVRANTVLTGQYLALVTRAIRFFLGYDFSYTYEPIPPGPQLLFSRHAGPGDAFLIARVVIRDAGRRLHMVGAAKLQWDPFLDIAGERLGFHYLHQNPNDAATELERIRALAASMDDDETLVIFPEGGNFTDGRRQRQIEALLARDRVELARKAQALQHTLLPRAGGTVAAIEGAPDVVIMFVAHAGLEQLYGFGDLWESVPLGRSVVAHSWVAEPGEAVADRDRLMAWLYGQWQRVDDWIGEQLAAGRTGVVDLRDDVHIPPPPVTAEPGSL